jgi:hypothetical protein
MGPEQNQQTSSPGARIYSSLSSRLQHRDKLAGKEIIFVLRTAGYITSKCAKYMTIVYYILHKSANLTLILYTIGSAFVTWLLKRSESIDSRGHCLTEINSTGIN